VNIEEIKASGLLELYALGQLSADEAKTVEGYLAQYPALRQEYTQIQRALEIYAQSASVAPPAGVRQNILDEIRGSGSGHGTTSVTGRGGLWRIIAMIMAVVIIGLIALLSQKQGQVLDAQDELRAVVDSCNRQNQQYIELGQLAPDARDERRVPGA